MGESGGAALGGARSPDRSRAVARGRSRTAEQNARVTPRGSAGLLRNAPVPQLGISISHLCVLPVFLIFLNRRRSVSGDDDSGRNGRVPDLGSAAGGGRGAVPRLRGGAGGGRVA